MEILYFQLSKQSWKQLVSLLYIIYTLYLLLLLVTTSQKRSDRLIMTPTSIAGVCLSVTVCRVPRSNSRTVRSRKPKNGMIEGHHTCNQWTYLEVKTSNVKVIGPINAVTDNCRVSLGSESGIYEFPSGKLHLHEVRSRNYEWESGASRQHPEFLSWKNMAAEYDLEGKILQSVYLTVFATTGKQQFS